MDKVFDASRREVFGCCELFRFFEEKRKSDVYLTAGGIWITVQQTKPENLPSLK
jgi:hypothetical protein